MWFAMSLEQRSKRLRAEPKLQERDGFRFMDGIFGEDLRQKRVLSLSHGVLGVLHGASAAVHTIGHGLAVSRGQQRSAATTPASTFPGTIESSTTADDPAESPQP